MSKDSDKPQIEDESASPCRGRPFFARQFCLHKVGRRGRWCLRVLCLVPLVMFVGLIAVTRGPIAARLVLPAISSALNVEAKAGGVLVKLDGTLVLENLTFGVEGVSGPAGELMAAEHAEVDIGWWSTLMGEPVVHEVRLTGPVVRISQSVDDESVNIESFSVPSGGGGGAGGAGAKLPRVVVMNGAVELGEHSGHSYTTLKRLLVGGALDPVPDADSYIINMRQLLSTEEARLLGKPGIRLRGSLSDDAVELSLTGVTLEDWPASSVPSPVRGIFEQLAMEGLIADTVFTYSDEGGLGATVRLENVAVNLPVTPEQTGWGGDVAMRLRESSGTVHFASEGVTAQLHGLIEDLPFSVDLRYEGTNLDAPFRCELITEGFKLERDPDLLPFAPAFVRKQLRRYSSPTGTVDARVVINRAAGVGQEPGEIDFNGLLEFRGMTAAYEEFPYAFGDLSGVVYFDRERIELMRIEGIAETGAELSASGVIKPHADGDFVEVDIRAKDLPLDHVLAAAFGPKRAEPMDSLLNRDAFGRLVAAGLAPDDFVLGGMADVVVKLRREIGAQGHVRYTVEGDLERLGLVSKDFPYPIEGHDVRLLIDDEDEIRLLGGTFHAAGDHAREIPVEIEAVVDLHRRPGFTYKFWPQVDIRAQALPIDNHLMHALAMIESDDGDGAIAGILRGLRPSGEVDLEVRIARDENGKMDYVTRADFRGLTASPASVTEGGGLGVDELAGWIEADRKGMRLDLSCSAKRRDDEGGELDSGLIRAAAQVGFGPKGVGATYKADVSAVGVAADAPIEDLVSVFSTSAGVGVGDLREFLRAAGTFDLSTQIAGVGDEMPSVRVEISNASDVAIDLFDGRLELARTEGKVVAVIGPTIPLLRFEQFEAQAMYEGEAAGLLRLDGSTPLIRNRPLPEDEVYELGVSMTGARFESPLIERVFERHEEDRTVGWYSKLRPRGVFDLEMVLLPELPLDLAEGRADVLGLPEFAARGVIQPRNLTFTRHDREVSLGDFHGGIEFAGGSGEFRDVRASGEGWSVSAGGTWTSQDDGRDFFDSVFSIEAEGLTPELVAMLPVEVAEALEGIEAEFSGGLSLDGASLSIMESQEKEESSLSFSGALRFEKAAFNVGAKVDQCNGVAQINVERHGDSPVDYQIDVLADQLLVSGVSMTDGRARIIGGQEEGRILIPLIAADCHGGRFVGSAGVRREGVGRTYDVEAQLSGVRFRPMLDELAAESDETASLVRGVAAGADTSQDRSRGTLDAELAVGGMLGDPTSRRGRGFLRIAGGQVVRYPMMTMVVEMSNLQLPMSERLDYAQASFYLDDERVTFEDLSVFSKSIAIVGFGEMSWPGLDLDLRFSSRPNRPIPIVSDVLAAIRDELVTTRVRGTLGKQRVAVENFTGAKRFLERIFGEEESEQERRLRELQLRADRERARQEEARVRAAKQASAH